MADGHTTTNRVLVDYWGRERTGYVVETRQMKGYRLLGVVFRDADLPEGLRNTRVNWYRDDEVVDA